MYDDGTLYDAAFLSLNPPVMSRAVVCSLGLLFFFALSAYGTPVLGVTLHSYSCAYEIPQLGEQIATAREQKQLTQEQLAHASGLTISQLRAIEEGMASPSRTILHRIQLILDCELIIDAPSS